MDAALASGILDKTAEKKVADYPGLSKADIKLVVSSMEVQHERGY